MRTVAFGEPPGRRHAEYIAVIESRKQEPELACAQLKLVLDERRCRGEIPAVYVVDEERGGDEQHQSRRRRLAAQRAHLHGRAQSTGPISPAPGSGLDSSPARSSLRTARMRSTHAAFMSFFFR